MTDPTPRPWRQGGIFGNRIDGCEIGRDRRDRPIYAAIGEVYRGGNKSNAEARANLALIVRAVNAHDELVAALDRLVASADSLSRELTDPGMEAMGAIYCAREALAKARGETP